MLMIAEESTAWPGVTDADVGRRTRVQPQVEPRVDARLARLPGARPDPPAPPPQRDDVRPAVRLRRTVRAAAEPRRGRARQGQPAGEDGWRRLAAVRRACAPCSPGRRRCRVRRCCSWAPRWRRGRNGTTPPSCRGTCWSTPPTAASTTRCRRSTRRATRGRRCGDGTPTRVDSSGSTPTTPTTASTRSSGGTPTAPTPSCASPTSRRWCAADTASGSRGPASGRSSSTPTWRRSGAAAIAASGPGVGADTLQPRRGHRHARDPVPVARGVGPGRRRPDVDALAGQHRPTPPAPDSPADRHSTFATRNLRTGRSDFLSQTSIYGDSIRVFRRFRLRRQRGPRTQRAGDGWRRGGRRSTTGSRATRPT